MVPLLKAAFRVDQHVSDVLHIADLPLAAADFEQRIVGG